MSAEFKRFKFKVFLLLDWLSHQPYYLAIAIIFPSVLRLYEMQTALSKIWTQVTISISYDNHNTTSASIVDVLRLM